MTDEEFRYSFKTSGLERKQIAKIIAEALSIEVVYAGAPSFCYRVADWKIDREGIITTPEMPFKEKDILRKVLDALKTAGVITQGNGTVIFTIDGHTENTLRNVVNLTYSKQSLLKTALDWQSDIVPESLVGAINTTPINSLDDFAKIVNNGIDIGQIQGESNLEFDLAEKTVSFSFFNASLEVNEVFAFITLCRKINEQAKKQKFSSSKQRENPNECYSMRVWLIRLGFVGEDYKTERKVLLSRLDGNAAYKMPEALEAAKKKREQRSLIEE